MFRALLCSGNAGRAQEVEPMHGSIFIWFDPSNVNIDSTEIHALNKVKDSYSGDELNRFRDLIKNSSISHLSASGNANNDGYVMIDNGLLKARVGLSIEARTGTLTAENNFADLKPEEVRLICFITVHQTDKPLLPGNWHSDDRTVGVTITRSPTESDQNRMKFFVAGSSLKEVRRVLIEALKGEIRPQEPWNV